VDWVCLDSYGTSRVIMILWDKRVVEKIENCIGVYTLAIKFRNIHLGLCRGIWSKPC
jgi:hypothetical protein